MIPMSAVIPTCYQCGCILLVFNVTYLISLCDWVFATQNYKFMIIIRMKYITILTTIITFSMKKITAPCSLVKYFIHWKYIISTWKRQSCESNNSIIIGCIYRWTVLWVLLRGGRHIFQHYLMGVKYMSIKAAVVMITAMNQVLKENIMIQYR